MGRWAECGSPSKEALGEPTKAFGDAKMWVKKECGKQMMRINVAMPGLKPRTRGCCIPSHAGAQTPDSWLLHP